MYTKIEKALAKFAAILSNLSGVLMLSIVACVTIQIIGRNILKIGTPWTEEVARYLLIWLTFIAAPVVLWRGEHLMVDLFYSKFSPRTRQIVHLLSDLFILAFIIYLLVFGVELCMDPKIQRFKSPAARIPRVYIYGALPVGAFLLLIYNIADIIQTILVLAGKREDTTSSSLVDETVSLAELDAMKEEGAK